MSLCAFLWLTKFDDGKAAGGNLNVQITPFNFQWGVAGPFGGALDLLTRKSNRHVHISTAIDLCHPLLWLEHTVVIEHRHNPTVRGAIN